MIESTPQQIIFGKGQRHKLLSQISNLDRSRTLIIAAKHITDNQVEVCSLISAIQANEFEFYSDFSLNPKLDDACKGASLYKSFEPTLMLAVGGGSVIDMAKLSRAIGSQEMDALNIATGSQTIKERGCTLIAMPTTAGTGSESTHFAVVYVNGEKYSLAHPWILPEYAIIDPLLTYSLPSDETAYGGMDALCQAIESYWSLGSTNVSQILAAEAMGLIWNNIEGAVNQPTEKIRANMAKGANLAGQAINLSKTTAPHALSYYLTSHHGVPHGHAVGLFLGAFFLANEGLDQPDSGNVNLRKKSKNNLQDIYKILDIKPATAEAAEKKFNELLKKIGLKTRLRDVGVSKKELNKIVLSVNVERLANNPIPLTHKDLYAILAQIY